jgi:hypothetical protein
LTHHASARLASTKAPASMSTARSTFMAILPYLSGVFQSSFNAFGTSSKS